MSNIDEEVGHVSDGSGSSFSVLGANPSKLGDQGVTLHEEIVVRWTSYLQKGLDKDIKKNLIEKYPKVTNCDALEPPRLNAELSSCLPEYVLKQDKFLARCQEELAHGLIALGSNLNQLLQEPEANKPSISALADAGQLITNVHHTLSSHRRYSILPHVKSDCKKVLESSEIDQYLFGSELQELVKSDQTIKKVGSDIKSNPKPTMRTQIQSRPGQSRQHLNYRRPFIKTKMKERRGTTSLKTVRSRFQSAAGSRPQNQQYRKQNRRRF